MEQFRPESKLFGLATDLVAFAGQYELSLELMVGFFGAESAVFWRRTSHDPREFAAEGIYNRPDLEDAENPDFVPYFRLSEENVIFRGDVDAEDVVLGELGVAPFDEKWLSKSYTRGLRSLGIVEIAVCPLETDDGEPFGAVSMYFAERITDPVRIRWELRWSSDLFSHISYAFADKMRAIATEQALLGHEILAQVDNVRKTVEKIRAGSIFKTVGLDPDILFQDVKNQLDLISQLTSERSFRISVERGKAHAIFFDPFREFQNAAQPVIQRFPRYKVELGPIRETIHSVEICMAPSHFKLIVTNFISNAAKYSVHGSVIRPSISYFRQSGTLELSVTNTSLGIPDEEQKKIWEAGYRSRKALDSDEQGAGLGLQVVRDICETYEFAFGYRERGAERGVMMQSTFWIEIPRRAVRVVR